MRRIAKAVLMCWSVLAELANDWVESVRRDSLIRVLLQFLIIIFIVLLLVALAYLWRE